MPLPQAFSLAIGEVACSSSETVMFCQQLEAETQVQAPGFPHDPQTMSTIPGLNRDTSQPQRLPGSLA